MPHVIYLHSALTQDRIRPRDDGERRELLRFQRIDVFIAMGIAGLVNMSMLIVAASLFHGSAADVDTIEGAHAGFRQLVGAGAAIAFGARAARLRASPARASAPTPARSSCRASSTARSRCCCAGWSR